MTDFETTVENTSCVKCDHGTNHSPPIDLAPNTCFEHNAWSVEMSTWCGMNAVRGVHPLLWGTDVE